MPLCSCCVCVCVCLANSYVDISQQYSKYLALLVLAPKADHAASASPRYSVRAPITFTMQHLLTHHRRKLCTRFVRHTHISAQLN